ncbi:MAG: ABC transporter permease [Pseudomonadota bacterium]
MIQTRGGLLRFAPHVTLTLMAGPVLAGLTGTLIPALGLMGGAPFASLLAWPGLSRAAMLSLTTGLAATALSLAMVLLILAALQGTAALRVLLRLLSPLLSVPHAAAALGLAFLISPSGWIARALSPWATGWTAPPDLLILNDPAGLALIAGLVAKEVPFLLLMALAALPQTDAARRLLLAQTLGRGQVMAFVTVVLPVLYGQLRLPVYAVLAYAMTVVDMAVILGPSRPPTLSVQVVDWMMDPGLAQRSTAAAGAVLQLALVVGAVVLWRGVERLTRLALRRMAEAGWRGVPLDAALRPVAIVAAGLVTAALIVGLAGLALWSLAGLWTFPEALPASLTLQTWLRASDGLWATAGVTLALAVLATGAALALVLACLEAEHRHGLTPTSRALWLLYLPLVIPQVAFLPGLQGFALMLGLDGSLLAVAAAHLVFVLPYVFLSLSPAWRAWDGRVATAGASLGASDARILWRLRLPMLLRAILTAAAVGVAVSVGQYLPTLLIGGGRVETLTTEAVALSSGGNRRLIGATALLQMALPAVVFALAVLIPGLAFRHRRGMGPAT